MKSRGVALAALNRRSDTIAVDAAQARERADAAEKAVTELRSSVQIANTASAGLSSAVIQGELRGHLGYQGVTITDALEAGALTSFGSSGQRAVLAAQAGMDLLLCSARDVTQGQEVTAALAGALEAGRLKPAAFNAAMQRVTALRSAL